MDSSTLLHSEPESSLEDGALAAELRLVVGRLARRLRQHDDSGLSASLQSALWTIERLQPVTLGDLAAGERVRPPTITRVIGKLEAAGLVTRVADEEDRRVARVALSANGRRLLERIRGRRTAYLVKRLRALSEDDRRALRGALPVLERLLAEEPRR